MWLSWLSHMVSRTKLKYNLLYPIAVRVPTMKKRFLTMKLFQIIIILKITILYLVVIWTVRKRKPFGPRNQWRAGDDSWSCFEPNILQNIKICKHPTMRIQTKYETIPTRKGTKGNFKFSDLATEVEPKNFNEVWNLPDIESQGKWCMS